MEYFSTYNDSKEEEHDIEVKPDFMPTKFKVNTAPDVDTTKNKNQPILTGPLMFQNYGYEDLTAATLAVRQTGRSLSLGQVEEYHIQQSAFNDQYNNFASKGVALHPTGRGLIGNPKFLQKNKDTRKRKPFGDASSSDFQGPWASFVNEEIPEEVVEVELQPQKLAKPVESVKSSEADDKQKKSEKDEEDEGNPIREKEVREVSSVFHGKETRDYMGRSFVDPPSHLKPSAEHECFMPKKIIHTWTGHKKGVNAIRFSPGYGHLLLSASMDGMVKVWDVQGKKQCLRTYMGHTKAVRDICFSNDGRRFLSAGYDGYVNLWDTETGDCIGSYSKKNIPLTVKFNPDSHRNNMFLAGYNDKKIIQWDTNTGGIVQQYDQHLGAVNCLLFIDEARRFVSSSDDKSLRIWEWGIPVVIKYISEPHMHAMPSLAAHPTEKFFAAQSLDNQILVYSTKDRFRMHKKKKFTGHMVAGYACQINFSPDGHFLMSGDSEGKIWFWDWQNNKMLKNLKAHDAACIGAEWHPLEASNVATCGWDGNIHLWD